MFAGQASHAQVEAAGRHDRYHRKEHCEVRSQVCKLVARSPAAVVRLITFIVMLLMRYAATVL
jgi:hypothetical protein